MSAVGVLSFVLLASGFPEAEDPIPDHVGPTFAFTAAGFGGVIGGIAFFAAPASRRESAIRWGGLIGFVGGALLYLAAVVNQVASR